MKMTSIFYVNLFGILSIISQIHGDGGECSTTKIEICKLEGKKCLNNECGQCFDGFIRMNNECLDSSYSQSDLNYLENCDPNVDPTCKEKLRNIKDQIINELTESYNGNDLKDVTSPQADKPTLGTTNRNVQVNGMHKKDRKTLNNNSKVKPSGEHSNVEFSSEILNRSDPNALSRKSPTQKNNVEDNGDNDDEIPDVYFLIIIIACTLSGVAGIALSGYCWYKLHHTDDKVSKGEYIPGVKKTSEKTSSVKNGDRKLDYKAEMYHYVHTKNQIAAMEKAKSDHLGSDGLSNDEEDEVEDFTVYECPGLAPTGDMTVVNPLFSDQEVTGSDEGRNVSNHSSPGTPGRSNYSPPQ